MTTYEDNGNIDNNRGHNESAFELVLNANQNLLQQNRELLQTISKLTDAIIDIKRRDKKCRGSPDLCNKDMRKHPKKQHNNSEDSSSSSSSDDDKNSKTKTRCYLSSMYM
jgi:hypothetical protein